MAYNAYLKLAGLNGPSTASGHIGEIDIESYSIPSSPLSALTGVTGGGSVRDSEHNITIRKAVDQVSGNFYNFWTSGKHFANGQLTLEKADDKQPGHPYLTYKLNHILVIDIRAASSKGASPFEEIGLYCETIELKLGKV